MSLKSRIFEKIHTGNLVYNTCWEDPRCDRQLMQLDHNSQVVMLTSAGCNALDYLIEGPASIHCIDMNPRQNALLDLKLALIGGADHHTLFQFFGQGRHAEARQVLEDVARTRMPDFSGRYWQRHIRAFSGAGLRRSFYYFGTSGTVAFWLKKFLEADRQTRTTVQQMFDADDLCRQRIHYYRIEPRLLNRFLTFLVNSHVVQSMLGVPQSQQQMAREAFRDGMTGYIRYCFRKVFAAQSLSDNYFWRLYFFGQYDSHCAPRYLDARHYNTLRQYAGRVSTVTNTLSGFLKQHPGQYTHFVLLDHQDWLAANNRPALEEEWDLIFQNSAPGAKVLLRSATFDRQFLPRFVLDKISFDDQAASQQHELDRVGTYASVHFGTIQS